MASEIQNTNKIQLIGPEVTKQSIRLKVWDYLEEKNLANFPRPVHNRIPNFKGAETAGKTVASLPEFVTSRVVKVNPDKPQEEVRYQVLSLKKELLVPTPRLKNGLFNRLTNNNNLSNKDLKVLASRQGIDTKSKPVPIGEKLTIDLVIIGSVAVDKLGHRIGKGEGFADLEFALAASHHAAVNQNTIVISTVHDCQVFESLPENLFTDHDVPVDILVTPTEIIRVENRLPKPTRIIWNLLTEEKLKQVSLLNDIRAAEKQRGIDVTLMNNTRQDCNLSNKSETDKKKTKLVYFSNIPKNVRVSSFKQMLRNEGFRLASVKWTPFKQAAAVHIEEVQDLVDKLNKIDIDGVSLEAKEIVN